MFLSNFQKIHFPIAYKISRETRRRKNVAVFEHLTILLSISFHLFVRDTYFNEYHNNYDVINKIKIHIHINIVLKSH